MAWQPGLEECAKGSTGAEGQPNLGAAIHDRVYTESILDRVQLFFWGVLFDILDESVSSILPQSLKKLE